MERFLTRHGDRIEGIVSGFDRLLFRGPLRSISCIDSMDRFLSSQRVRYKDFGMVAARITAAVRRHAAVVAQQTGRPWEDLRSSATSKEARAREIIARDGVTEGLVCMFSCVESCRSVTVRGDRASQRLRLVSGERRCDHLYFSFLDHAFGVMHVRLQAWLPLSLQICVNGREWLARQATAAPRRVQPDGKAVMPAPAWARVQGLADGVDAYAWAPWLNRYATFVNPWLDRTGHARCRQYSWSVRESAYTTDVVFRTAADLHLIYPRLLHQAIEHFQTSDVLRVLGWGHPNRFKGEAHRPLVHRPEGVRIRHGIDANSIKMDDKAGRLLRVEMTLNNPHRFRVRRRNGAGRLAWRPLRRGIADMRRRAQLGRAARARDLDALSVVGEPTPSHHLRDPVSQRVIRQGRPYRPLRPISPHEVPIFRAVLRGEFALQGFRNRDLQQARCPEATAPVPHRRHAARVTRLLRLRRAHRLIHKVGSTRYSRVSPLGHRVMTTALAFRDTDVALLAA